MYQATAPKTADLRSEIEIFSHGLSRITYCAVSFVVDALASRIIHFPGFQVASKPIMLKLTLNAKTLRANLQV